MNRTLPLKVSEGVIDRFAKCLDQDSKVCEYAAVYFAASRNNNPKLVCLKNACYGKEMTDENIIHCNVEIIRTGF